MLIILTAEHIARGERGNCGRCPVVFAVEDAIKGHEQVYVFPDSIYIGRMIYNTPVEARQLMERFDKGLPVSPITFDLPIEAQEGR